MEDKNTNGLKDKMAGFLKEKGIYMVLLVSIAVVGVAAASALWPKPEAVDPTPDDSQAETVSMSEDERLSQARQDALEATPLLEAAITPIPDFTQKPAETPAPLTKVSAPVSGSIVWGYAVDQLIYSKTLNQWMTHAGVDIASPKGTEVFAAYAGTVEAVYEDDLLGITVEIAHENGMKTLYANLKKEPPVKKGRKINAGTCVGYVGDTAASECAEQSHLHFEMHIDGMPVDPSDYILIKR